MFRQNYLYLFSTHWMCSKYLSFHFASKMFYAFKHSKFKQNVHVFGRWCMSLCPCQCPFWKTVNSFNWVQRSIIDYRLNKANLKFIVALPCSILWIWEFHWVDVVQAGIVWIVWTFKKSTSLGPRIIEKPTQFR